MPTLQQQIANKFIERLAEAKTLEEAALKQLRTLLAGGKKLKPDDLTKLFTSPADGELK